MTTTAAIVIPFRDRGIDPLRKANLLRILDHWEGFGAAVHVVDDGRTGDTQFNRHAAYNRGREAAGDAEVIVYTESDMLLNYWQIDEAVKAAAAAPGLVVPFTQYRYLTPTDSEHVRVYANLAGACEPESTMDNGQSIGAVNVVSQATLDAIGQWDETFEGNWYDDNAMHRAFEIAAGPTRWITGPAYHLYHLPGWKGDHLTDADRAATAANKRRLELYRQATTPERIRELTAGAQ